MTTKAAKIDEYIAITHAYANKITDGDEEALGVAENEKFLQFSRDVMRKKLDETFTEDEVDQVLAMCQSPVMAKLNRACDEACEDVRRLMSHWLLTLIREHDGLH